MSPQSICHNFGIDEKFYHWTALNIRASIQAWDDVDSILTKKVKYIKKYILLPIMYIIGYMKSQPV